MIGRRPIAVALLASALAACGSDGGAATPSPDTAALDPSPTTFEMTGGDGDEAAGGDAAGDEAAEELFPEVVGVEADQFDDTWTFHVTLSSPYDTPERYADAWRIESVDGETVYGVRELLHDHQFEQPFTRSTSGVEIPAEVRSVVVRGRDQISGWSPDAVTFELPG